MLCSCFFAAVSVPPRRVGERWDVRENWAHWSGYEPCSAWGQKASLGACVEQDRSFQIDSWNVSLRHELTMRWTGHGSCSPVLLVRVTQNQRVRAAVAGRFISPCCWIPPRPMRGHTLGGGRTGTLLSGRSHLDHVQSIAELRWE